MNRDIRFAKSYIFDGNKRASPSYSNFNMSYQVIDEVPNQEETKDKSKSTTNNLTKNTAWIPQNKLHRSLSVVYFDK